jgi:hypothetical protein
MNPKAAAILAALKAKKFIPKVYNPFDDNNWKTAPVYESSTNVVLKFDSEVLNLATLGELVKGLESEDDYHSVIMHHLLNNVCPTTITNFRRFLEYVPVTYSKSKFFYANEQFILYKVE